MNIPAEIGITWVEGQIVTIFTICKKWLVLDPKFPPLTIHLQAYTDIYT